ncbi:MAG: glycosyl hydrolase [Planctomycetota bacterium]|nr:MAG: glycosyl hydrolase [Planctomycetota bacterium]
MKSLPVFLIALLTLCATAPAGQEPASDADSETSTDEESPRLNAELLKGLALRGIGPALMSGRIADLAIDPEEPNTWYVAVGSGGVWKTTNAGTTWKSIFDGQGSYSIGCLTIDPGNHDVIWVGTGEAVGGRHVGFGDGVYRSRDGGGSFENLGLSASEHIAKIVVDPRDSDVVFVAAQGPLWTSGGERGLYKTIDAGATWEQVLAAGPWTGVTDVALDPRDPDVMYAATHQRHRTVAALINGGPESGIHKSTDGGRTWRELTSGLPKEDMGKIALAVSPQRPDVVYASIELAKQEGGTWVSEDRGESWEKRGDYVSGGTGPHYYQELWCDPYRADVLYHANVVMGRSEDGGRTWAGIGNDHKHVDNHALAFHPRDKDFLLVGCDGGLYRSYDRGATYAFVSNLPLTQFYKVDVDYDWPVYHVLAGTQDNNTQYGPVRTLSENGIANRDWRITIGGDGHDGAIDPEDPDILYCESQQGYIRRFDRRTGESVDIRPQPEAGEADLRFNWDSPILISPQSHTRIYFGSRRLYRSDDRGDSWTPISGDLSRNLDRFTLPMMGRVWSIDALWDLRAMSRHGNITSISESPLVEGLLYVGTDDGLLHVSEDGGGSWRRIEGNLGVPEMAFVNDVKADRFDPDTVYAVLDDHKHGDYAPYVVKSTDRGRSWTSIVGDLPERHVTWRLEQDHVKAGLLFLGTEFGLFVTLDGGERWIPLQGGDAPTIPYRDLAIQRRENDLVGATFGRSFWVLDDYSPLREITEERLESEEFLLFEVRDALLYVPDDRLGGLKGSQGDAYFVADNPPFGAVFTVYLRDEMQTLAEERREREGEVAEEGGDTPYPGWAALKVEDREEAPALFFEVRDASGAVVSRVDGETKAGLHRTAWDLRYAPFTPGTGRRGRPARGPLVAPGDYTVRAFRRQGSETRALGEPRTFTVVPVVEPALARQDREAVLAFQMRLGELQRAIGGTLQVLDEALEETRAARDVIQAGRKPDLALLDEARRVELALLDAREALVGDPTAGERSGPTWPSIRGRAQSALFGTMGQTYGPTLTHRRQAELAFTGYGQVIDGVRAVVERDLVELLGALDAAGAPWTPGRPIPELRRD